MYHDPKPITPEPIWPDDIKRGDVVLFRFPVAEKDGETPKLRPCLVLETGMLNGRRSVTLAYGTSAHPKRNYGYEVIVKGKALMRAAGLTKPTRFIAIRRIAMSTEHPGYVPLCGTPVIGRLDAPLLQRMDAVRERLWAEHDIAAERRPVIRICVGEETGILVIDEDEATIVRRIFHEYVEGKSPLQIAAGLNADLIPSPAKGKKKKTSSGHWKQNAINGNPERGTGILNNELYLGRRVWNRLRYSKDPTTGRRVSRLNDRSKWTITDVPDLRIIDDETWAAAKARQTAMRALRGEPEPGTSTLGVTRGNRRRKYLLSGLVRCGLCGGPMTIAGGNPKAGKRRYYCANAREKGAVICTGMPGVLQSEIEELALSGIQHGMMQNAAYERFRRDFETHLRATRSSVGEDLKRRDKMISEQQAKVDFIFEAIETGEFSPPLVVRLNKLQAELDQMKSQREAATPTPVELPEDLPALHRAHVEDLVGMLSDASVRDRASDALRDLISAVVVRPRPEGGHEVELEGKLLEMLAKAKPAGEAGFRSNGCSFELVAGVGFEPTTFRL